LQLQISRVRVVGMSNFLYLFLPRLSVPSIFAINLDTLREQGICGIMLDLDNTIVQRDQECFSPAFLSWIKEIKEREFKVCIISNNWPKRVSALAQKLAVPAISRAGKPRKSPFLRALNILGTRPQETAVIGDQVLTDILGGNRLGLYTILVTPLPGKEYWATRLINRWLEKLVFWWGKRKLKNS